MQVTWFASYRRSFVSMSKIINKIIIVHLVPYSKKTDSGICLLDDSTLPTQNCKYYICLTVIH